MTLCKHYLGTAAQKNKFDDPDTPYLLIEHTFREKCIFMDYID